MKKPLLLAPIKQYISRLPGAYGYYLFSQDIWVNLRFWFQQGQWNNGRKNVNLQYFFLNVNFLFNNFQLDNLYQINVLVSLEKWLQFYFSKNYDKP